MSPLWTLIRTTAPGLIALGSQPTKGPSVKIEQPAFAIAQDRVDEGQINRCAVCEKVVYVPGLFSRFVWRRRDDVVPILGVAPPPRTKPLPRRKAMAITATETPDATATKWVTSSRNSIVSSFVPSGLPPAYDGNCAAQQQSCKWGKLPKFWWQADPLPKFWLI